MLPSWEIWKVQRRVEGRGRAAAGPLGVRGAVVSGEAGPRPATPCPAVGHGAAAPAREPLTSIPRRGRGDAGLRVHPPQMQP